MASERHRTRPRAIEKVDVSVVVVGEDEDGLAATLDGLASQRRDAVSFEVLVVRGWPRASVGDWPARDGLNLRTLDVATRSTVDAVNAGLARARAPRALLLVAGDVPAADSLVAEHARAAGSKSSAVIGSVVRESAGGDPDAVLDPVREGWVGLRPATGPAPPVRHVSLSLETAAALDGLDDRLHDLDVAVLDLIHRMRAAGVTIVSRPDLAIRATPSTTLDARLGMARAAGRSAQAFSMLLLERHAEVAVAGPARSRALLRWFAPWLRALARLDLPERSRLVRLAHRAAFAGGRGDPPLALDARERIGLAPPADRVRRPAVAVVVPFAGSPAEGARLLSALAAIERRRADEVIVVDNSRVAALVAEPGIRVLRAEREWSSYHARNVGARAASAPWLLFIDSDCTPAPWILDAYFEPAPAEGFGAVAGAVLGDPHAPAPVARFAVSASVLSQARSLSRPERPYAVTANLLVRREAWERLGGFSEGVRSGGDADLCWRLQEAGWELDHRARAAVVHSHRTTLRGLLRQYLRYGSGVGWLARRFSDAPAAWRAPGALRNGLTDLAAARFELAFMRLLTFASAATARLGSLRSNRPQAGARESLPAFPSVVVADAFPDADDAATLELVAQLARIEPVVVEAVRRPLRHEPAHAAAAVAWSEDDAPLERLRALVWLARRLGGGGALTVLLREHGDLRALATLAAVSRRVAERNAGALVPAPGSERAALLAGRILRLLELDRHGPSPAEGSHRAGARKLA